MDNPLKIPWSDELEAHVRHMISNHGTKQPTPLVQRNYENAAVEILKLIHHLTNGIMGVQVSIPYGILIKIYYHYKSVVDDLYNCNLIFTNFGRKGCFSHGKSHTTHQQFKAAFQLSNRLYSPEHGFCECTRSQNGTGAGFYLVSKRKPLPKMENVIRNHDWILKYLGIETSNIAYLDKDGRQELFKDLKEAYDAFIHGEEMFEPQYLELTYEDGTPFKCSMPRFGRYPNGRRYDTLTCTKKKTRNNLYYRGKKISEIGDVKSCFIRIIASLTKERSLIDEVLHHDIYNDCIQWANLNITRDEIKPYFQKYILSTPGAFRRAMKHPSKNNNPIICQAISDFMVTHFPISHEFISNCGTNSFQIMNNDFSIKTRKVKKLIQILQEKETQVINHVISLCKGATFTVHDAVLSDTSQDFDFQYVTDHFLFPDENIPNPKIQILDPILQTNQI